MSQTSKCLNKKCRTTCASVPKEFRFRYRHDRFEDLVAMLSAPRSEAGTNDTEKHIFELVIIRKPFNESDNPTLAEVLGKEIE